MAQRLRVHLLVGDTCVCKGARKKRTAQRIIISEAQPGPALGLSSLGGNIGATLLSGSDLPY